MDHTVTIQRMTSEVVTGGKQIDTWTNIASLRAQVMKSSTEEYIRNSGAVDESIVVFRMWWLNGLTNADRLVVAGTIHDIKEIKELGRRNGLEVRTVSKGQTT